MAIKPVTYQGVFNFKSNLYALEVKSRFIDQTHADGYYKGYGNELSATAVNNIISVGSGAFVIQGRMNEIESGETAEVLIENGKVGYLCARIETYHPSDQNNCKLIVKTGASLASIALTQQDTYIAAAETTNKIYEMPLYSFAMENNAITSLVKLIKPVEDYAEVKRQIDITAAAAQDAVQTSTAASLVAQTAETNSASAAAMVAAALTAKKVVTTAAMWSGSASPYTLTINDPIITADSWVDVYGFGSADKYILTNALDSTPIVTAGKFQIQFSSLHQGTLTIVYTVREVK